jgi:hypothetical protein
MNWKTTWALVGVAGMLLAFILLVENRIPAGIQPPTRLLTFQSSSVTNLQLRYTNNLVLRVERDAAESPWHLVLPIPYPAQGHAIEWLLAQLEVAVPQTEIPRRDLAEFGLEVPHATLTLLHGEGRTEISFGSKTTVSDGVYVQVSKKPGIFVLRSDLVDRLPRSHTDWRNIELFGSQLLIDRMEVRASGRGFTLDFNPTMVTRADPAKCDAFLLKVMTTKVLEFVTDSPRADLESYGLEPPEAELSFYHGTNVQFVVEFGSSPTNDPTAVYARRMSHTNIVLVPRTALETLQVPHGELRDLHLVSFDADMVDAIEVTDGEPLVLNRQTNGSWQIVEPRRVAADTESVRAWLGILARLEGTVEKDVVTDFANPYGLDAPARQYILRAAGTNSAGTVTNRVIAQLDLGKIHGDKIFARRPDEATVYSLSSRDVEMLPRYAWQLRDKQVWSFTTNQVHRLTVRYKGQQRILQRLANGRWSLAEGEGMIPATNPRLDETMHRLGDLQAGFWVQKGDEHRATFGFNEGRGRLDIELKVNGGVETNFVEFGRQPTGRLPYALAEVDGETLIFEFPGQLYFMVLRDLLFPLAPPQ